MVLIVSRLNEILKMSEIKQELKDSEMEEVLPQSLVSSLYEFTRKNLESVTIVNKKLMVSVIRYLEENSIKDKWVSIIRIGDNAYKILPANNVIWFTNSEVSNDE